MKITANIATYPPRLHALKQCVASLYDQVDEIHIMMNEYTEDMIPEFLVDLMQCHPQKIYCTLSTINYTDNGKFIQLDNHYLMREPQYYFTCDDDLIYPPDYVEKTIENIKKYGSIVTYHGRLIRQKGVDYYLKHQAFKCLSGQSNDFLIDVCGTGVTAFDTRYFHPRGLASHKLQRMSDLIFSLEAAKQGKKIGCCARKYGWIKAIQHEENIYDTESKGGNIEQNKLADQIFEIKHETRHN